MLSDHAKGECLGLEGQPRIPKLDTMHLLSTSRLRHTKSCGACPFRNRSGTAHSPLGFPALRARERLRRALVRFLPGYSVYSYLRTVVHHTIIAT
jgi:hypothetical protein